PEHFELKGFGVILATDVTAREVVSRLKNDLIEKDALATPDRVDLVQTRIRNLIRSAEATVGFIAFDESAEIDNMQRARAVGRSLLLDSGTAPACKMKGQSTYAEALARHEPVVLQDISGDNIKSGYEAHLAGLGFKSFVLCPLVMDDRMVGLMEIGSPTARDLNAFSAMLLLDVAPLFTVAIQRTVEERSDRTEAVIKKRYTSIHPSVEWRFKRAALDLIEAEASGDELDLPEIVFDQVFPLYGLSDIRGSSSRRNRAIQADLVRQLELALATVQAGAVAKPLMVLDEMAHKIRGYIASAHDGSGGDDEQTALDFLSREVEPLLDHVAKVSDGARARVEAYRESLDPKLGVVYDRRRAFEDSVAHINGLVSRLIDEDNEVAQSTVPHLFERFKTDGVDYNLYVGESISETGKFHPLLLKELRLRQLALHCRIEWESRAQLPSLEIPMELTHLVLVQDIPLSIRFRTDEKRFDVDGAYNIRYEIVKKRIDKATIRGSGERLTQPGMLAIVYSQFHEAQEYRRYLKYLADVGYLEEGVEDLEIEDLQGVYGLKALRAKVATSRPAVLPKDLNLPTGEMPKALRDRIGHGVTEPSRT
ncbi:MAG: GAF domain-containing protein, partial [Longimicrobiales bacterium]